MSILVKGMEMPKSCMLCPFCVEEADPANGEMCMVTGKLMPPCTRVRLEDCPLVPVPPHGRLGDLDKLEKGLRLMAKYQHGERQQGILGCCETIRLAPTIIPASEEGE